MFKAFIITFSFLCLWFGVGSTTEALAQEAIAIDEVPAPELPPPAMIDPDCPPGATHTPAGIPCPPGKDTPGDEPGDDPEIPPPPTIPTNPDTPKEVVPDSFGAFFEGSGCTLASVASLPTADLAMLLSLISFTGFSLIQWGKKKD